MGTEGAPCGGEALFGEDFEEALVERFGHIWTGHTIEAGTPALAAVAVEGELRDAEHAATDVQQRAVHLAVIVGEYAQIGALFGAEAQGGFVVNGSEADEEE